MFTAVGRRQFNQSGLPPHLTRSSMKKITYKEVSRDPTPALERKMNSLLLTLKRSGKLSDGLYL